MRINDYDAIQFILFQILAGDGHFNFGDVHLFKNIGFTLEDLNGVFDRFVINEFDKIHGDK